MIDSPIPLTCSILVLALPGVWWLGRWLSARVSQDSAARILLAPGLGLAVWLLAIHAAALLTGSFLTGLWAGSLGAGLPGWLAWYQSWAAGGRSRPISRSGDDGPSLRAMCLSALLATLVVTPMAIMWSFHDEAWITGHLSIIAQLQNDTYPPRHLSFPEFPLRYHYGFNLLCAVTTALFRLPVSVAVDAVTLLCFGWTFCLLWLLGYRVLGSGYSGLTPILVLFGAGLPTPGQGAFQVAPLSHALLLIGKVEGIDIHPPTLSYFFQHPWSLGLPLGITVILLFTEKAEKLNHWRYVSYCLLLTMLSRTQVVLFVSLAAILLVAEPLQQRRFSRHRLVAMTITVAVALGFAILLAGLDGPVTSERGSAIGFRTEFPSFWGAAAWCLYSFGLLLPLGLLGLFKLRDARLFFGLLIFGGLTVFTFLVYRHSWDIDKFAVLASISLAVASGGAIAKALSSRLSFDRVLGVTAILLCITGGLLFATALLFDLPGTPFARTLPLPSEPDAQVISWLRARALPGEIVYRTEGLGAPSGSDYARYGGLAVPWLDWMVPRFGFDRERLKYRVWLVRTKPTDSAYYRHQRVRWMVLDDDDTELLLTSNAWLKSGAAEIVHQIGDLRIVRLNGPLGGPLAADLVDEVQDATLRAWLEQRQARHFGAAAQ